MADLFDILGPTMVGPSSSHTAGACRLGYVTHALAGGVPDRAVIELHGSFAMTGEGHGTKRAIVGGLLGLKPNDVRLRDSSSAAEAEGLSYEFLSADLGEDAHPNTARIRVWREGVETCVLGSSIGGGRIQVEEVGGIRVSFTGALPTLIVFAEDVPGTIAEIAGLFAERGLNLATMHVDRTGRGEDALMTIEADRPIPDELAQTLAERPWVRWIRTLSRLD